MLTQTKGQLVDQDFREKRECYAIYSLEIDAFYDGKGWDDECWFAWTSEEKARQIIRKCLWTHEWTQLLIVPCDIDTRYASDNRGKAESSYSPDFGHGIMMVSAGDGTYLTGDDE